SGIAHYLELDKFSDTTKWVDLIDVDSEKWLDYATSSNPVMAQVYQREGTRLREIEKQLAADYDCLAVVTDAEVEVFRNFSDEGRGEASTNGVDLEVFKGPEDAKEELKCVFVGVLNYKPNSDGVIWFCENVWPAVREKHPTATFEIVGRDPSPEVLALDQIAGVNVVGPVDDIRPHLWSASAIVTPMLISRGVQNKVLEAFASERPLVSSVPPLVGLDIELGKHALQAETPDEWFTAIDSLFADEQKRTSLGQASREWVVAHHRWDVCLEPFGELLSDAKQDEANLVAAAEEAKQA
ncbi:MAG: glycosyltransferase family 4 protein, partial [Planctomycetaceae bacterium]